MTLALIKLNASSMRQTRMSQIGVAALHHFWLSVGGAGRWRKASLTGGWLLYVDELRNALRKQGDLHGPWRRAAPRSWSRTRSWRPITSVC